MPITRQMTWGTKFLLNHAPYKTCVCVHDAQIGCRPARAEELAAVHDRHLVSEVAVASRVQQQEQAEAVGRLQQQQQHAAGPVSAAVTSAGDTAGMIGSGATAPPAIVGHGAELGCSRIMDCYIGSSTYACAAAAAGAAIDVAVAVARGDAPSGAAIIRPPGAFVPTALWQRVLPT